MEKLTFIFKLSGTPCRGSRVVCGVVGSGNLEIIVTENTSLTTRFTIQTNIAHYSKIWRRVINDFVDEYKPVGLHFVLNDNGATPAVVSLRLRQALELFKGYQHAEKDYLELDARARIHALVDHDSFVEWLSENTYSPHLAIFNLPSESDDGLIIGRASLQQKSILIAAQQKDFMGGAVGEIHGAKLTGLFQAAVKLNVAAVIVLIDSGGVRLQEANAGEIAISETIRAIFTARKHGIMTIGVVCGQNGAFGGMGIIASCLDYILIDEIGRIGVSGPEVIQAVSGVEAFNAQDRSLVWRVYGGKTRYLQGIATGYVDSQISSIRAELIAALPLQRPMNLSSVKQTHQLLTKRLADSANYTEEGEYLRSKYPDLATSLFEMNTVDFLQAAKRIAGDES